MLYSNLLKPLLCLAATLAPLTVASTVAASPRSQAPASPYPGNALQLAQIELDGFFEEADSRSEGSLDNQPRPNFSDLEDDEWGTEAVYSLLERYNCLQGFPDGTFRGEDALTRYQFAAGMNACLLRMDAILQDQMADLVTKEDLALLFRALSAIFEQPTPPEGSDPDLLLPPAEEDEAQAEE